MTCKLTYDEAIDQFHQIISFDEFYALSSQVYSFATALKSRKDLADREKLDVTKKALINLGAIADMNGKLLLESAKKYKSLIDQLEQQN